MTNELTAITLEIPERENLAPSLLSNIQSGFQSAFEEAEKWRGQALAINVTSLDQKTDMKLARTLRLNFKNIRVAADKKRKELKADALLMGRAIDGCYNILLAAIDPLERHLQEQEDYAERLAAAERIRIGNERSEALAPYLEAGSVVPQLADMTPEQWSRYLDDAKILCEAKIEAARKAEAERIAREQAEAAERERLRVENERLQREALEAAKAAEAERQRVAEETRRIEAERAAERAAAESALKAQQEAAAKAQREADEKVRKEREAMEAMAKEEAAKQAAIVAAEREKARIAEEARIKAEQAEAARVAQEEAKQKAAAESAKKADRAPDKDKALAFAATVRALKAPDAKTVEGQKVMAEITAKIEGFAKWIETQAATLN